ncbi:MAG: hypothetical protein E6Q77_08625 [Rhizobium sp.]|nr:MAG: hypothetical protein E6Q77_08625 [Rhizobium sp.]
MAVFRARTRHDISRNKKLRNRTFDAAPLVASIEKVTKAVSGLNLKASKPKRTRDDEMVRELVYSGAPGNYVTMTDDDGNFCVYRMKPAMVETGTTFGVTNDSREQIRSINERNAEFWDKGSRR